MDKKLNIFHALIWFFVLMAFPVFSQLLSLSQCLLSLIYFCTILVLGYVLMGGILLNIQIGTFTKHGIYALMGGFVLFGLQYLAGPFSEVAVYLLFALSLVFCFFKKPSFSWTYSYSLPGLAALLLFFAIKYPEGDTYRAIQSVPSLFVSEVFKDPLFFTSVVSSLKELSFLSNYEVGSPINYQIGSFLVPGGFSSFTGVSSHISLWSCWMPFYKCLGMILLAEFVLLLAQEKKNRSLLIFTFVLMYFFLAPLHPEYILKGKWADMVWLGWGYLLPGGNPPYTLALGWISLIGILVFHAWTFKYKLPTLILIAVLTSFLIVIKIPAFGVFGTFLGGISLYNSLKKKNHQLFFALVLSLISGILLYKITYESTGSQVFSLQYGYLTNLIGGLAGISGQVKILLVTFLVMFIWAGIRLLGIGALFYRRSEKEKMTLLALGLTFLFSLALPMFLHVEINVADLFKRDVTFDLMQFLRGFYALLSILSMYGLYRLYVHLDKGIVKKSLLAATGIWMGISAISVGAKSRSTSFLPIESESWYLDVSDEMKGLNEGLYAAIPNDTYNAQYFTAADLGTFWVTATANEGGYAMNNAHYKRWVFMKELASPGNSSEKDIHLLVENEVKYLISNPSNRNTLLDKFPNSLCPVRDKSWILEVCP